jgi:glycyl-tRNA synthetase
VSSRVDDSSVAIGRRYARMDEIGVPFIITVDFEHELDGKVTVRERDSCQQLRVPVHEVVELVVSLTRGLSTHVTWEEAKTRYPLFDAKEKDDAA